MIAIRSTTVCIALTICLGVLVAGCAKDKSNSPSRGKLFGTDEYVASQDDSNVLTQPYPDNSGYATRNISIPTGMTENTQYMASAVAKLESVMYDGMLLPLVNPAGNYFAVQQGTQTNWPAILARPDAPDAIYSSIDIYRIDQNPKSLRLKLLKHKRLNRAGIVGRSADANGFLIESLNTDGSRSIGKVNWKSGITDWLVTGQNSRTINAFGSLSPSGQLAWCRRSLDTRDDHFDLCIQGANGVSVVPAQNDAEWLMPTWTADGIHLYAFRLQDDGLLELVLMDCTTEETANRPVFRVTLYSNATRYIAYQTIASIQNPIRLDYDGQLSQMLIYHSGYDAVCLVDPNVPSADAITPLLPHSITADWENADVVVLGTYTSLIAYDLDANDKKGNEIARLPYIPRRTSNPVQPYVLFTPSKGSGQKLDTWVMEIITDPNRAANAIKPIE